MSNKLLLILALTVVIRLGALLVFDEIFAFEQTGAIHGSDAYDDYAQNLRATGVYGRHPGVPDAAIPPLYSYALAAVYAIFGRGYLQVGLFHILLDLASIVMLYHIGRRLLPQGEWVGALAGLFYACYPYLVFQNLTLIDTPFFMTLLHAFVLLMVLLRQRERLDRGTWLLAIIGGLILGLSVMARPITPPLALLVALWFLFRLSFKQAVLRLLPVAIMSALVLAPWIARNDAIFDTFVPMTTTSGGNFWQGNNELTVRYFRAGYDVQWLGPEVMADDPDSPAADRERFALAARFLRENPDKIPELLWVKFLVYWSIDIAPRLNPVAGQLPRLNYEGDVMPEESEDGELELGGLPPGDPVDAYSTPLFDQIGRWLHRLYWGPLLLLGLLGIVVSARHWREVSLLWFVQISMTFVYLVFHPSTRYRVPTDPLLFLFSAYALVWLYQWWRARRNTLSDPHPPAPSASASRRRGER
jgi:4-amino-4-deoxy-L-arabinose transferase-like glycosyltransferase